MSCPFHDVKGFLCALKGQFAHSPGQSEAAPWGFDTPVLLFALTVRASESRASSLP